jgi:hypothetical protein
MSLHIHFNYNFYPVGQGLFASGALRRNKAENPVFLWVYDCGTSSGSQFIDREILRLRRLTDSRNRIDLLILSHFDEDHVNGIVRLLQRFEVGTLLLPYMPLAQRLLIAFEEGSGGTDDPLTDFYLNPVVYLIEQAALGVDEIGFVPPSGTVGPEYPGEAPEPSGTGSDNEYKFTFETKQPAVAPDADQQMLTQAAAQLEDGKATESQTSIRYLPQGLRIRLDAYLWEFIPYNDDPKIAIPDEFVAAVDSLRKDLLSKDTGLARETALKKLKEIYDKLYGKAKRNRISLFLYSGPIYKNWTFCGLVRTRGYSMIFNEPRSEILDFRVDQRKRRHRPEDLRKLPCSILYSGDGYLNGVKKISRLLNYLSEYRVARIGVFQVMHHGSKYSWCPGTAERIEPLSSVFSSDPNRGRWHHPHRAVTEDFEKHGPVQVDKAFDFTARGNLFFEPPVPTAPLSLSRRGLNPSTAPR